MDTELHDTNMLTHYFSKNSTWHSWSIQQQLLLFLLLVWVWGDPDVYSLTFKHISAHKETDTCIHNYMNFYVPFYYLFLSIICEKGHISIWATQVVHDSEPYKCQITWIIKGCYTIIFPHLKYARVFKGFQRLLASHLCFLVRHGYTLTTLWPWLTR